MSSLTRISITVERELLDRFQSVFRADGCPTRSKAIGALLRDRLARARWEGSGRVVGAVSIRYRHHRRRLVNRLLEIQHDFEGLIVCTQHVHLDHDTCLEVFVVRGSADRVRELDVALRGVKGLQQSMQVMAE